MPGVAKSWDISDDRKAYTFHLREDAKWSNGEPLLAADFVYSFQRAIDPATGGPYASTLPRSLTQKQFCQEPSGTLLSWALSRKTTTP